MGDIPYSFDFEIRSNLSSISFSVHGNLVSWVILKRIEPKKNIKKFKI